MMVTRYGAVVIHSVKRNVMVHSKKLVMHDATKRDNSKQFSRDEVNFNNLYADSWKPLHDEIVHGLLMISCEEPLHKEIRHLLCKKLLEIFPPLALSSLGNGSLISSVKTQQSGQIRTPLDWIHDIIEAHKETTSPLTDEQNKALQEFSKIIEPFRDKLTSYKPPTLNELEFSSTGEAAADRIQDIVKRLVKIKPVAEEIQTASSTEAPSSSSTESSNGTEPIMPSALSTPTLEDEITVSITEEPITKPNPPVTSPLDPAITNNSFSSGGCDCGFDHNLPQDDGFRDPDIRPSSDTSNSQLPSRPSKARETNPTTINKVNSSPLIFFFSSLVLAKMTLLLVVFKKFLNPSQAATQNFNKTNNYSSQINQLQQSLNGLTALKGKSQ